MATMIDRALRAAKLDVDLYNEVEADTSLNQEALMVVILVSVASGIGSFIGGLILGGGFGAAILGLVVGVVMGIVNYYLWSYITYFVGTRLFGGTADVGELLRVLGYASAPRVLGLLSFIPCVGGLAGLVGAILSMITGVIAVREALDVDTGKAILTSIIGGVIAFVRVAAVSAVIFGVLGITALGVAGLGDLLGGGN